jgi:hypothetical protein
MHLFQQEDLTQTILYRLVRCTRSTGNTHNHVLIHIFQKFLCYNVSLHCTMSNRVVCPDAIRLINVE